MSAKPRRRRKEARPGELLEAALALFAERGFAATRIDDIAARAGVSKGTVYLYFPSKEAMFEALVRSALVPNIERIVAGEIQRDDAPSAAMMAAIFRRLAATIADTPLAVLPKLILAEGGNFPDLVRMYRAEVVERGIAAISGLLARGIARGEFRPVDIPLTAKLCIAPVLLGVLWNGTFGRLQGDPIDLPSFIEQHLDILLRGLRAEPPK